MTAAIDERPKCDKCGSYYVFMERHGYWWEHTEEDCRRRTEAITRSLIHAAGGDPFWRCIGCGRPDPIIEGSYCDECLELGADPAYWDARYGYSSKG